MSVTISKVTFDTINILFTMIGLPIGAIKYTTVCLITYVVFGVLLALFEFCGLDHCIEFRMRVPFPFNKALFLRFYSFAGGTVGLIQFSKAVGVGYGVGFWLVCHFIGIATVYTVLRKYDEAYPTLGREAEVIDTRTEIFVNYDLMEGNIEDDCSICLSTMQENQLIRMRECLHVFHKECVDIWLRRKQTCPLCRIGV